MFARASVRFARPATRPTELDSVSNQYSAYRFAAPSPAQEVELAAEKNGGALLKSCKYNLTFFLFYFLVKLFFFFLPAAMLTWGENKG